MLANMFSTSYRSIWLGLHIIVMMITIDFSQKKQLATDVFTAL